jgi:arylsulfatase A-like enzyme
MDAYVGRVYQALHDLRLDDNTIVIYTTDHGEMAGTHRTWTKHNMFEQSVGVPLVISFPGRIGAKTARSELVEQVDLFPTLAELASLDSPRKLQGRSFAGLLQGRRYQRREFAYSEYYFCRTVFTRDDRYVGKPPLSMVRTDRWKLNYLSWDRCELYDTLADPGEFENRIDDPGVAGIVRELKNIAARMIKA